MARVRTLIVDDSPIVRAILRTALSAHPQIEVVGVAADGQEALTQIAALRPDVVTLDVEMPNMNGLEVLERAAGRLPVSFIMCSTLTQSGARITLEALRKGAFDYITKPDSGGLGRSHEFRADLAEKVVAAAGAKGRQRQIFSGPATARAPSLPPNVARGWVLGIGISCGGPQTLHELLPNFPSDFVPIVITQHMPAGFTKSFASQLNSECAMNVREAAAGEVLRPGSILIAPGGKHLRIVRRGVDLVTVLDEGPKVSGHRPSVDVMFSSLASACGKRCVGVIMTGMGSDGAEGIRLLRGAGAPTVAQDEATSLVFGMPKVAIATGCIDEVAPLETLPQVVARLFRGAGATALSAPV